MVNFSLCKAKTFTFCSFLLVSEIRHRLKSLRLPVRHRPTTLVRFGRLLIVCTAAAKVIAFLTTTTGDPTAAAVDPSAAAGEPTAAAAVGASSAATGDRHRVGVEISPQLRETDTV